MSSESRTIRDMLMTYGHNGGTRLTDEQLAELILTEVRSLPIAVAGGIGCAINVEVSKRPEFKQTESWDGTTSYTAPLRGQSGQDEMGFVR